MPDEKPIDEMTVAEVLQEMASLEAKLESDNAALIDARRAYAEAQRKAGLVGVPVLKVVKDGG